MSVLRAVRKLVLGETWSLPIGVALVLLFAGLVLQPLLGDTWHRAGGFVVLAGAVLVLTVSVARSGRR